MKIGLELQGGFLDHSPYTVLKLREATCEAIGANLDPSHMWWQGIDQVAAFKILKKTKKNHAWQGFFKTSQRGFEPPTYTLGNCCSILLSYWDTYKKNKLFLYTKGKSRPDLRMLIHEATQSVR